MNPFTPLATNQTDIIPPFNVTHFSTYESGGVGRAAYRIHRSLVDNEAETGVHSRLRVIHGCSQDPTVLAGPAQGENLIWRRLRPRLASRMPSRFDDGNSVLHSICWPDSGVGRELACSGAQLIHLHWIGRAGLSIEEVGHFPQPLVWTLHDQWAFLGAEHYVRLPPADDRRFVEGYLPGNRPEHERGPDLNRLTWQRKRRAWRRPIHIVCPSQWLAYEARASALIRSWSIHVIPHPIDCTLWSPSDRDQARQQLGLPQGVPLILFTALAGTEDPRKGADLLQAALECLSSQIEERSTAPQVVIVGAERGDSDLSIPFPVHFRGVIADNAKLRLHYAACDVLVIPSRQDNFPNTGLEAQACGLPVVGFRIGGLPDIVEDRTSGALADPFDPASLASSILWVLADPTRSSSLAYEARQRAIREWHPRHIAGRYAELYRSVLAHEEHR
ncbi:glycosyltransferase [Synechococcus sp. CBW1004]|uniref:glycosyltransferase n=1 Tax=Synechococcus sp. CBW1004 TaxID=1353136 RepID=UPI001E3CEA80|nr:glycosyltransferase [Synechococcus sp. CBW1004]